MWKALGFKNKYKRMEWGLVVCFGDRRKAAT